MRQNTFERNSKENIFACNIQPDPRPICPIEKLVHQTHERLFRPPSHCTVHVKQKNLYEIDEHISGKVRLRYNII